MSNKIVSYHHENLLKQNIAMKWGHFLITKQQNNSRTTKIEAQYQARI